MSNVVEFSEPEQASGIHTRETVPAPADSKPDNGPAFKQPLAAIAGGLFGDAAEPRFHERVLQDLSWLDEEDTSDLSRCATIIPPAYNPEDFK